MPADLLQAHNDPGMRGILELDGQHIHNAGNIFLLVTNWGLIGSRPGSRYPFAGAPSAQWPAGSGTDYLYAAGLWVGAAQDGELRVTTGQPESEFRPGKTELDHIYVTREGSEGGSRRPADADDDHDGQVDEDWLDGRDNDGDGKIDEDFAAASTQEFFCEYGDTDPVIRASLPEHLPLGIHVQQATYAWEDNRVGNFIAMDFKVINAGTLALEDVYVGLFADCDIGPRDRAEIAHDDQAGFWEGLYPIDSSDHPKTVKLSLGYMFDDDGDDGASRGYIGLLFLGAQDPSARGARPLGLRNFRMFAGRAAFEAGGDPANDFERYSVLDGTAPRSLEPAVAHRFRPPQVARNKGDYRMIVSAGPFASVEPGDTLGFQAALVLGEGFAGMQANAAQAQLAFDGAYLDCDGDPSTGAGGRETPICGPRFEGQSFRVDPCDTSCSPNFPPPPGSEHCWAKVPRDGCLYVNADCDVEQDTGVPTGVYGQECLIHWLISSAPPPPRMRLIPKEHEVDVLWDNRSETTPDPRLHVLDFESYRIWRADDWRRPFGTNERTGPGASLWMEFAEYDVPRNGIGSDTGLDAIRYTPAIGQPAVEYYREWFAVHPFEPPPGLPGYTPAQSETAQALARGVLYYRWVDPPFIRGGQLGGPCPANGGCPQLRTGHGLVNARCNRDGICAETSPPPHSGVHYFYSVTATDHKLVDDGHGHLVPAGPGLAGGPGSNFAFVDPPTAALQPSSYALASAEIRVVPNPATPQTMAGWQLQPNNADPTGIKVEFQHLPAALGLVTIFTLAGDRIQTLRFDGRTGRGSLPWNLVSRNGQDVASGVYLYVVEAEDSHFRRFVGKFVVVR